MNASEDLRHLIIEWFERKKESNPAYSLRSLARGMQISPSFLSRVLQGKKAISKEHLKSMFKLLDVDIESQQKIKALYVISVLGKDYKQLMPLNQKITKKYKKLSSKKLSLLSKWYYVPLLELMTANDFQLTTSQLSDKLKVTESQILEGITVLEKLKIIALKDNQHKFSRNENFISLSSGSSKPEIRNYHLAMITKASEELQKTDNDSFQLRLIAGITFGANPEKLNKAKAILNDAIHKASQVLTDEDAREVYQINLQLFPLTKVK